MDRAEHHRLQVDAKLALAVMLALAIALAGCAEGPAAVQPRPLELIASGDTAGWIVPCGCTSNQSGGLPRRASYVARARQQADVILVDVGGAAGGKSDYDLVKFLAIARGEQAMGSVAHN